MALRYKVKLSDAYRGHEVFIEAHQITDSLTFDDYLKEVDDPALPYEKIHPLFKTKIYVFHPERNYDYIKDKYHFYRLETGQIIVSPNTFSIGEYVRYDATVDEFMKWSKEEAAKRPNLELVE